MTYRVIDPADWHLLRHEFDSRSVPMPDPALSVIFGAFAERSKKLQAFLVIQRKLHAEPLVSYNPMAVPGLLSYAERTLTDLGYSGVECYVGTSQDRVRGLVWRLGFHPSESMFVKRLAAK